MDLTGTGTVVLAAVSASTLFSSFITYFLQRRNTTGRINTSEASVLWQQSQNMIASLITEKNQKEERITRVEDQRDRLIDAMTNQIHPVLEAVSASQRQSLELMIDMAARVSKL